MELNNLPKTTTRRKKRLGRGIGSGKGGHTVGRGQKGQKSRSGGTSKHARNYGKHRGFAAHRARPVELVVGRLEVFAADSRVDAAALAREGLMDKIPTAGVKLLAGGTLDKPLTVSGLLFSAGAKQQIEQAGGKIVA